LSGYGKKAAEQGALTFWRAQIEGQVGIYKEYPNNREQQEGNNRNQRMEYASEITD
jgi:hypothetical protein